MTRFHIGGIMIKEMAIELLWFSLLLAGITMSLSLFFGLFKCLYVFIKTFTKTYNKDDKPKQ